MFSAIASSPVGHIEIWELLVGLNVALTALLKWRQKQNHENQQEQHATLLSRIAELEANSNSQVH